MCSNPRASLPPLRPPRSPVLTRRVSLCACAPQPTFTFTHKGKKLAEIRGADVQGVKATLEDLKKEISE